MSFYDPLLMLVRKIRRREESLDLEERGHGI